MTEQEKIERDTSIAKNQVAQIIEELGIKDKKVVNPQNLGSFSCAIAIFYLANIIKDKKFNTPSFGGVESGQTVADK